MAERAGSGGGGWLAHRAEGLLYAQTVPTLCKCEQSEISTPKLARIGSLEMRS